MNFISSFIAKDMKKTYQNLKELKLKVSPAKTATQFTNFNLLLTDTKSLFLFKMVNGNRTRGS